MLGEGTNLNTSGPGMQTTGTNASRTGRTLAPPAVSGANALQINALHAAPVPKKPIISFSPEKVQELLSQREIKLRTYQNNAVVKLGDWQTHDFLGKISNVQAGILDAPTASGKTVICAKKVLNQVSKKHKVLFMSQSKYMTREQAVKNFMRVLPDTESDPEARKKILDKIVILQKGDDLNRIPNDKEIIICSKHLLVQNKDRLSQLPLQQLKTIISDEAHHDASPSIVTVLNKLAASIRNNHQDTLQIIGATATPVRHTKGAVPLSFIYPYENLTHTISPKALIDEGFIKKPEAYRMEFDFSIDDPTKLICKESGDFQNKALSAYLSSDEFIDSMVDLYKDFFLEQKKQKCVTAYFNDQKSVLKAYEAYKKAGYSVGYTIDGSTKYTNAQGDEFVLSAKNETDILSHFGAKNGFDILLSCNKLLETADLPQAEGVIVARVTRSYPLMSQLIGRAQRLDESNPDNKSFSFVYVMNPDLENLGAMCFRDLGYGCNESVFSQEENKHAKSRLPRRFIPSPYKVDGFRLVPQKKLLNQARDREWSTIRNTALKDKYPSESIYYAINCFAQDITYQLQDEMSKPISLLRVADVLKGQQADFGIFRKIAKALNISKEDLNKLRHLAGFETLDELKEFVLSKDAELDQPRKEAKHKLSDIFKKYNLPTSDIRARAESLWSDKLDLKQRRVSSEVLSAVKDYIYDFDYYKAKILEIAPKRLRRLQDIKDALSKAQVKISDNTLYALAGISGRDKVEKLKNLIWPRPSGPKQDSSQLYKSYAEKILKEAHESLGIDLSDDNQIWHGKLGDLQALMLKEEHRSLLPNLKYTKITNKQDGSHRLTVGKGAMQTNLSSFLGIEKQLWIHNSQNLVSALLALIKHFDLQLPKSGLK